MMPELSVGHRVLASYKPGLSAVWHERLLCGRISADRWIVCTPDRDIYLEKVREDYDRFVVIGPRGGLPRGFANATYRFEDGQGPLQASELQMLLAEGAVLARAERGEELDEALLEEAAEGGDWFFLESRGEFRQGARVAEVRGLEVRGVRGLLPLDDGS